MGGEDWCGVASCLGPPVPCTAFDCSTTTEHDAQRNPRTPAHSPQDDSGKTLEEVDGEQAKAPSQQNQKSPKPSETFGKEKWGPRRTGRARLEVTETTPSQGLGVCGHSTLGHHGGGGHTQPANPQLAHAARKRDQGTVRRDQGRSRRWIGSTRTNRMMGEQNGTLSMCDMQPQKVR